MSNVEPVDTGDTTTEAPATTSPSTVPWEDFKKLRDENASYRQKYQPYERAMADFGDEDRDFLLNWLPTYHQSPEQFAAQARQIADRLTPAQLEELEEAAGESGGLSAEQVQQIVNNALQAQEAERAKQTALDGIYGEITTAGYQKESMEATAILWIASEQTNGNIAQAIEKFKARDQEVIDKYRGTKGGPLPTPVAGGAPGPSTPDVAKMSRGERMAAINAYMDNYK